ncbi:MAG TPA: electron transfer flavoprotein subunit beta/FixA family protein [Spirochaetota bacterium]|nr:electron transfer flavoprotein subunit beta/FixA family protein [Spirochaetota bacterium]
MKILVCVKQVADSESVITIDPSGSWIEEEGLVFRMNRFDEYAVEESLVIRDAFPGSAVTAISAGPERAESTVRRAMEMGADRGVRVALETRGYTSPMTVAALIAAHAREEGYDLILCGAMAEDDMQAQVGPLVAEMLNLPSSTSVIAATVSGDASAIRVEREIEGGVREAIELSLPALVSVQPGINRPRYPSLSNVLRAKNQPVPAEEPNAAARALMPERLARLYVPERSGACEMLEGSPAEKSEKLLAILSAKSLI